MKAMILTVSDKGSIGQRQDTSGPALVHWLKKRGVDTQCVGIVPDEAELIANRLEEWVDQHDPQIHRGAA